MTVSDFISITIFTQHSSHVTLNVNKNEKLKSFMNKFQPNKLIAKKQDTEYNHCFASKLKIIYNGIICDENSTPNKMGMIDGSIVMILFDQIGGGSMTDPNMFKSKSSYDSLNIDVLELSRNNNLEIVESSRSVNLSDIFMTVVDNNNQLKLYIKKIYYDNFKAIEFKMVNNRLVCILVRK
jgi:hypothetical protein